MTSEQNGRPDLWAYAHGEMSDPRQKDVENAVNEDAALSEELADVRRTDRALRELMPLTVQSEEDLVGEVLSAWESEHPGQHAEAESAARGPVIRFPIPWPLALAAAAALVLFFGIQTSMHGPLQWQVQVQDLHYRGENKYSKEELNRYANDLKEAVASRYEDRLAEMPKEARAAGDRNWYMELKIQELPDGFLEAAVSAREADSEGALSWRELFEHKDTIARDLRVFADEVAAGLVAAPARE